MPTDPAVVVSAVDFGWGSAGKLDAILAEVARQGHAPRVVVLGSALGRPILGAVAPEAWYSDWPAEPEALRALLASHDVVAGLVVLDPETADLVEKAGTPCVYVDSLPYLWTAADPVPTDVAAYCAQLPLSGEPSAPALYNVHHLRWVGPITKGSAPIARRAGVAVVSFGGLHSPGYATGNPSYLRLVLDPALEALRSSGMAEIHVCGNLDAATRRQLSDAPGVASSGAREHDEFLELVTGAELLVTSPGLTTILEAMQAGTPVVCLPPQNISQILNAEQYGSLAGPRGCVTWPGSAVDLEAIGAAREDGELAALHVMAMAIEALRPEELHDGLVQALCEAIDAVRERPVEAKHPAAGRDGATEIASVLIGLLSSGEDLPPAG